jgi:hypothetical protein
VKISALLLTLASLFVSLRAYSAADDQPEPEQDDPGSELAPTTPDNGPLAFV